MGKPQRLSSCCGCNSLKVGTIIAGTLGILLSIATIVIILTTRIDFKTVVSCAHCGTFCWHLMLTALDFVSDFRRFNLTIRCENHFDHQSVHDNHFVSASNYRRNYCELQPDSYCSEKFFNQCLLISIAQSISVPAMDHSRYHVVHWPSSWRYLHSGGVLHRWFCDNCCSMAGHWNDLRWWVELR